MYPGSTLPSYTTLGTAWTTYPLLGPVQAPPVVCRRSFWPSTRSKARYSCSRNIPEPRITQEARKGVLRWIKGHFWTTLSQND